DGYNVFTRKDFHQNQNQIKNLVTVASRASHWNSVDPMEKAISQIVATEKIGEPDGTLIKEYSLSHDLLAMTRVVEQVSGSVTVSTKGALEAVLNLRKVDDATRSK